MSKLIQIKMFENNKWVPWDGRDVTKLKIEEEVTEEELKEFLREKKENLVRK